MNCKNKSLMTKRKAFTLIELLIVIAIIGILFIVLVSKVDFATDKSKATGVQTDFRSFQVAIESVAKEHAGLATFGWDTGDTNGDRIRNSYDKGDTNQNGKQDPGEVFIGSKTYGETWTNVYTLTNPADANDKSAIIELEEAINKNLDPKLHITIHDDLTISMANQARDPWGNEYYGYYITNATVDNKDRGAIVIYSNGANKEFGSEHSITGGVVTVNVPGNNAYGKDDYSMAVTYTYVNGYGEVKTTTTGFSQNQGGGQAGSEGTFTPGNSGDDVVTGNIIPEGGTYYVNAVRYSNSASSIYDVETIYYAGDYFPEPQVGDIYVYGDYAYAYKTSNDHFNGNVFWGTYYLKDDSFWCVAPFNKYKTEYGQILSYINGLPVTNMEFAFYMVSDFEEGPTVPGTAISTMGMFNSYDTNMNGYLDYSMNLKTVRVEEGVGSIESAFCRNQRKLTTAYLPSTVNYIGSVAFMNCEALEKIYFAGTIEQWCKIFKEDDWISNSSPTVICSNGIACLNCIPVVDENASYEATDDISKHRRPGTCSVCNNVCFEYEQCNYVIVEGTITQNSEMTWAHDALTKCSYCNRELVKQYSHNFVVDDNPTYWTGGSAEHNVSATCKDCQYPGSVRKSHEFIPKEGAVSEQWNASKHITLSTCTLCNDEQKVYYAHSGGTATCQSVAICEQCGSEYGSTGSHIVEDGKCITCNTTLTAIESDHTPYLASQSYVVLGTWDYSDAKSVNITITYQTEGTSYDWISICSGTSYVSGSSHSSAKTYLNTSGNLVTTTGTSSSVKFGGRTKTTKTFNNVNMTNGTVIFKTDGSGQDFYGVTVTITPNY